MITKEKMTDKYADKNCATYCYHKLHVSDQPKWEDWTILEKCLKCMYVTEKNCFTCEGYGITGACKGCFDKEKYILKGSNGIACSKCEQYDKEAIECKTKTYGIENLRGQNMYWAQQCKYYKEKVSVKGATTYVRPCEECVFKHVKSTGYCGAGMDPVSRRRCLVFAKPKERKCYLCEYQVASNPICSKRYEQTGYGSPKWEYPCKFKEKVDEISHAAYGDDYEPGWVDNTKGYTVVTASSTGTTGVTCTMEASKAEKLKKKKQEYDDEVGRRNELVESIIPKNEHTPDDEKLWFCRKKESRLRDYDLWVFSKGFVNYMNLSKEDIKFLKKVEIDYRRNDDSTRVTYGTKLLITKSDKSIWQKYERILDLVIEKKDDFLFLKAQEKFCKLTNCFKQPKKNICKVCELKNKKRASYCAFCGNKL